jgi:ParB-like chromosome segregation protein Spo0J
MDQRTRLEARSTSPGHCSNRNANLKIVYRRIDTLQPDPSNPRRHSKKQIGQIAESIKVFGFIVPILIDRDGKTIAGHGRVLAARALGMTKVPTVCLDHLNPAQARVFMIADNKLTENATWDDQLLAQQFKDLSLLGLDFSLEVTGFEMGEIDLRIASLEDMPGQGDDPADVLPETPAGPPVGKIGDLWLLGRNRLLCASRLPSAPLRAKELAPG